VSRFARFRALLAALLLLETTAPSRAADGGGITTNPDSSPYILVGFVGGFVRHDNPYHGPVIVARHLRQKSPKDTHVQVFENRHRRKAYKTIVQLLDRNNDGNLSTAEKGQARIILFGQSWGASAAVALANDLNRIGVPVLLTVQVDSVAKPWQHDDVIPENVAVAVNFYQPHGIVHGRPAIRAADDAKTQILGNYQFDYKQTPVQCEGLSWFDRTIMPDHMQSECDPNLWGQVESLVREHMELGSIDTVANPEQHAEIPHLER